MLSEIKRELEEELLKSRGKGRNPYLMFDCDGGAVNIPYIKFKSIIETSILKIIEQVEEGINDKVWDIVHNAIDIMPQCTECCGNIRDFQKKAETDFKEIKDIITKLKL
uniref:Uncharacterized protein n=1 Tax=viral metagenome TaxID=1070528 RepID=A0A6M3JE58_9ZZZZ